MFICFIFQVQTQTCDDNAEKEIQTNEIELSEKWTQRPVLLINELDCFSPDYLSVNKKLFVINCMPLSVSGSVLKINKA